MGRNKEKAEKEPRSTMDRVSLALTLVAVAAFAIFTGYLVGQYAVRWVASPLGEVPTPVLEEAGTSIEERVPSSSAEDGSQGASTTDTQPSDTRRSETQNRAAEEVPETTSTAGSSVYRVHVGRYETRDAAAEASEALKAGTPTVPDAWVLFDQATDEYRVQVGAFSDAERANQFVQELRAHSYDAFIAQ